MLPGVYLNSLRRNLRANREVRNAFAHATDLLHFDDTQFDPLLGKFPHYYDEDRVAFSEHVPQMGGELRHLGHTRQLATALANYKPGGPEASSKTA
jgi:hypothetical protein